jgi:ferredoxin
VIRIIHQRAKCIGCNACVEAVPHRWRISKRDGKCTLVGGKDKKGYFSVMIDKDEYEANVTAAKNCPVKIIKVVFR